jgi:hypothetical protein
LFLESHQAMSGIVLPSVVSFCRASLCLAPPRMPRLLLSRPASFSAVFVRFLAPSVPVVSHPCRVVSGRRELVGVRAGSFAWRRSGRRRALRWRRPMPTRAASCGDVLLLVAPRSATHVCVVACGRRVILPPASPACARVCVCVRMRERGNERALSFVHSARSVVESVGRPHLSARSFCDSSCCPSVCPPNATPPSVRALAPS